jgi:hypothetical protein
VVIQLPLERPTQLLLGLAVLVVQETTPEAMAGFQSFI